MMIPKSVKYLLPAFLLGLFLAGCAVSSLSTESSSLCPGEDPWEVEGDLPPWGGIQGALLTSRLETLDDLKQVVRLEYYPPPGEGREVRREDSLVRLTHCSGGRQVVSLLQWGIDEDAFFDAFLGGVWEKMELGLASPYSVAERVHLRRIFVLSRWRQNLFGEGDVAFFDLASHMVDHINTPDQAFLFPRDSSDKGYLNTFNHITAQAFLTSMYSEELADFVADVHERKTMPELISGAFRPEQLTDPNTNAVDNYVDILNNEWGQELGKVLRVKYGLDADTPWTPELLRDYLNDIQQYYSWGLDIGFEPFRAQDTVVVRFVEKLEFVRRNYPE